MWRFDLDYVGACLGHQYAGVRALKDLAEIDHGNTGKGHGAWQGIGHLQFLPNE
jgi:hypothetical protein